jgi:hypothetical protein
MSKNLLGYLDHLSLDKAAGSGIPEIKTILSGAHSVDMLMHRLYFYAMHRLRNPWISWWAHSVHEVIWFGTLSRFGLIARLVLSRCPTCRFSIDLLTGKEGPFVHIASCIGNIVSRFHRKYENNEGMSPFRRHRPPQHDGF